MNDCLAKASQLKRDFGDQFISVEHLLLAVADTDGITKKVFQDGGVNLAKLKEAVMSIRGSNKVTSRNPEVSYEALKQYSRDLTAAAAEGKLDPVIGRDEEIRRAIQILSRRTKNNPILLGKATNSFFVWTSGRIYFYFVMYMLCSSCTKYEEWFSTNSVLQNGVN